MAVREVIRLGHPALRQVSAPVAVEDIHSADIQQLITDLIDTCYAQDGVGLAAPQVAVNRRVVMMEWARDRRNPDAVPDSLRIVINPEITFLSDETLRHYEGCLSVPDLRGEVTRCARIRLRGLDRDGRPIDEILLGFAAAVAQHECDHLDGIVYLDRLTDLKSLGFVREHLQYRTRAAVP